MITKEFYITRKDGVNLYRTYSTEGLKIRKVGTDEVYDEAIDVQGASYEYEETDTPVEEKESESQYMIRGEDEQCIM